jgi:hypothetical protein
MKLRRCLLVALRTAERSIRQEFSPLPLNPAQRVALKAAQPLAGLGRLNSLPVKPQSPAWRSRDRSMYSASSPVHCVIGMYSHAGVIAKANLSARHSRLTGKPMRRDQQREWQ